MLSVKGGKSEAEGFGCHSALLLVIGGKGGEKSAVECATKRNVIFKGTSVVYG